MVVSRWDAPHDSGLRERALFDPGERVRARFGFDLDTIVLLRPDAHVAALLPYEPNAEQDAAVLAYLRLVGRGGSATVSPERSQTPEALLIGGTS